MARKKKDNPETDQDQAESEEQRENGGEVLKQKYPVDAEGYEVLSINAPLPPKDEKWLEEFKDHRNVSDGTFERRNGWSLNELTFNFWGNTPEGAEKYIEAKNAIAAVSQDLFGRLAPRSTHEMMIVQAMIGCQQGSEQLQTVAAGGASDPRISLTYLKETERFLKLFDKFQASLDRHRMQEQKRKTEVKRQEALSQKTQTEELKRKKLELEIKLLEEKATLLLPDPEPIRLISDESADPELDLQASKEDPALEKSKKR